MQTSSESDASEDSELDDSFSGVVLNFKTTPEFEPGNPGKSLWQRMRELLKGTEGALGFELAAGVALFLPGLVVPVFGKIFVDDILIGTN